MIKVATILLVIMLVFAGLYSLLVTFAPHIIAGSTMEARAGKTMDAITDTDCAEALIVQTRHLGIMAVAVVIALFFIVFTGFQKGERWAWWCCLVTGVVVWGYGVYIQASEADMLNLVLHLVGTVLLLLGVLLPIRSFFGKKG
jgi:hypothetical protein